MWPVCPFGTAVGKRVSCDPFQEDSDPPVSESLSIENALWAGTVVASGEASPFFEEYVSNLKGKGTSFCVIGLIIRRPGKRVLVAQMVFSARSWTSGELNWHLIAPRALRDTGQRSGSGPWTSLWRPLWGIALNCLCRLTV